MKTEAGTQAEPEQAGPEAGPPDAGEERAREATSGGFSPGASMRRHPRLVLVPVVALLALALCAGLARTPTYKASARLAVGGLSATNPAELMGFADAAQQLAQTYSRSVQGDGVVSEVARQAETSPEQVRSHLSASPIPETPVFQLEATADSPDGAIELTNLASQALAAEVDRSERTDSAQLLEDYRAAELERERATRRVELLSGTGGPELAAAQSEQLVAEARASSLREAYGMSLQSQAVPLQVIQEADRASSDRGSVMQLLAFIAVVVGLVIGIALAVFRDTPGWDRVMKEVRTLQERAQRNRALRAEPEKARGGAAKGPRPKESRQNGSRQNGSRQNARRRNRRRRAAR